MKGRNMATILVDYENVGNINGLRGVDVLKREDTLIIFFSDNCKKSAQIICNILRKVSVGFV